MAAVQSRSRSLDNDIFASVFPPAYHTTPTPEATPNIGTLTSPGAPFGGFNVSNNPADEIARFNRAWSSATRFLTLQPGLTGEPRDLGKSPDAENALHFLLSSKASKKQLQEWTMHDISTHFRHFVLPALSFWEKPIARPEARNALSQTAQVLQEAQRIYLAIDPARVNSRSSRQFLYAFMNEIKSDYHVLVLHSLPRQRLQKTLASYLYQMMDESLETAKQGTPCVSNDHCECSIEFDIRALQQLRDVGLGGTLGERAFAHSVHRFLQGPAVERRCFAVDWNTKRSVVGRLRTWVHDKLVPALERAVATLSGNSHLRLPVQQFVSAAVNSFGRLRVDSLFDYVCSYPFSQGAVLDLKDYLTVNGSAEKAHLCSTFSDLIQRRIFHAGASTTEILSVYISVIDVFRLLDARGVLLEKVAVPIRNYLRSRDDTVSTIATSFLADIDSGEPLGHDQDKVCGDIAKAVATSAIDAQDDRMVDWNDMEWVPDPMDAGPNYKSAKSDDVVAYILNLFEPDDFMKAFSNALGQHLLESQDKDFIKETKIIELLKSRLDATRMQHAEVMLSDMRYSSQMNKRLNPDHHHAKTVDPPTPREIQAALPEHGISLTSLYNLFKHRVDGSRFQATLRLVANRRNDLYFAKRTRLPSEKSGLSPGKGKERKTLTFEAKILSSQFWPPLREGDFRIPHQAQLKKQEFEQAYVALSGQRKLEWRPALDITNISLGFPDRTFEDPSIEVFKATIIDAFATERQNEADVPPIEYDENVGLSVEELVEALDMSEELVHTGISYWLSKRILFEKSSGRYAVLETLDMDVGHVEEPSQLDMEDEQGAVVSQEQLLRQMASTYQNFIISMLQNGGSKQVGGPLGITNIMKMVLPNFGYGDEDVKWLLEDMELRDEVVRKGDAWALA